MTYETLSGAKIFSKEPDNVVEINGEWLQHLVLDASECDCSGKFV